MDFLEIQFIDKNGKLRTAKAPRDVIINLHVAADDYDRRERDRNRGYPYRDSFTYQRPTYDPPKANPGAYPGANPFANGGDPFADLRDAFSNIFQGMPQPDPAKEYERLRRERAEREKQEREKQAKKPNGGKFSSVSAWVRLCTIAGVEETTPRSEKAKIIRKAQRKCHPDTGGSHDEWIMLEDILKSV